MGVSVPTVLLWRERYGSKGLEGVRDGLRPGRPRTTDHAAIVAATLKPPPTRPGVTHWSSRLLAERLDVSAATIARAWRAYEVQPWRSESLRFSTDPEMVGQVTEVVGLYLAPPENAIELCSDKKSQIHALDRTQPVLPMQPHLIEGRSHDCIATGPRPCSRRWTLRPET